MSFARKYDQFQQRGAEITAVCVDSPAQNRAMIDKLVLPFRILRDPEGEFAIKRYGVWDEQGRIAIPSIFVVAKDQTIRYTYVGQDFADRPGDQEVLDTLEAARGLSHGPR